MQSPRIIDSLCLNRLHQKTTAGDHLQSRETGGTKTGWSEGEIEYIWNRKRFSQSDWPEEDGQTRIDQNNREGEASEDRVLENEATDSEEMINKLTES